MINSKILLQNLENYWQNFKMELSQVDTMNVPRFVGMALNSKIQIHGFADALMKAYGCCLYGGIRIITQ